MIFFDGNYYFSSPEKTPDKESVAKIIDIKGSTKFDKKKFIKGWELVEKELLESLAKKN